MSALALGQDRRLAAAAIGTGACLLLYALRVDVGLVCNATAAAAQLALSTAGVDVQRVGMQLHHAGGFRAEVGIECTALLPVAALWVALWAVGPAVAHRLRAALVGALALIVVNTVRIGHLVAIGAGAPEHLWLWHIVIWQALIISLPLALFLIAVRRRAT